MRRLGAVTDGRNPRLRRAMRAAGLDHVQLALEVGCNPKTAQRWYYEGRVPHRTRAESVANVLDVPVEWLFPSLGSGAADARTAGDRYELYNHLGEVPDHLLNGLIMSAQREIDVVSANNAFLELFASPALDCSGWLRARVLVSPDCGWRPSVPDADDQVELRTAEKLTFGSMLRADDAMLIIASLLGEEEPQSPALMIFRAGKPGIFDSCALRFERLWRSAG
ncbi:transcriptional regulator with XRE-family HTH domain [Hamadaea flava]|uniref:Helix-turn-helix domain-containing protein n=1 Tax=Hamadaea flava TaxID=1742688 RepID=A0ABV8M2G1_9ACTN|nr:helix-turn-helix transcriptional regulator [Hamadaea flava]MCP2328448.1 transcriptional regulator with XRE-family HTH domain [Hamadaea flava]